MRSRAPINQCVKSASSVFRHSYPNRKPPNALLRSFVILREQQKTLRFATFLRQNSKDPCWTVVGGGGYNSIIGPFGRRAVVCKLIQAVMDPCVIWIFSVLEKW